MTGTLLTGWCLPGTHHDDHARCPRTYRNAGATATCPCPCHDKETTPDDVRT